MNIVKANMSLCFAFVFHSSPTKSLVKNVFVQLNKEMVPTVQILLLNAEIMGAILLLIEFAASEGWKVTRCLFVLLFTNPHLDPLGFCVTVGSIVVYWLSQ